MLELMSRQHGGALYCEIVPSPTAECHTGASVMGP